MENKIYFGNIRVSYEHRTGKRIERVFVDLNEIIFKLPNVDDSVRRALVRKFDKEKTDDIFSKNIKIESVIIKKDLGVSLN